MPSYFGSLITVNLIYLPRAVLFDHFDPERVRAHGVYGLYIGTENYSYIGVITLDYGRRGLNMRFPFWVPILCVDKVIGVPFATSFCLEPLFETYRTDGADL